MITAYWIFVILAALVIGYTMAFQRATLLWGKLLAPCNLLLPRGMQDAITPQIQTLRNILMPVLLLVALVTGVILLPWYIGVLGMLATFVLGGISRNFFPEPDSKFFHSRFLRSLEHRKHQFQLRGDSARLEAIGSLIERLKTLEPQKT